MANFDPIPAEHTDPWYEPFVDWAHSVEQAVEDVEAEVNSLSWAAPSYPTAELPPLTGEDAEPSGSIAYDTTRQRLVIAIDEEWVPVLTPEDVEDKADISQIVVLGVIDHDETPPSPGVWLRRPTP